MAIAKTCEEYVLQELLNTQKELEAAQELCGTFKELLAIEKEKYNDLFQHLNKRIKVTQSVDGTSVWVDFKGAWKEYERDDFDWFVKKFNLFDPLAEVSTNDVIVTMDENGEVKEYECNAEEV